MGMFGLKPGAWFLNSKLDNRWNCSGDCMCGGFTMPKEVKEKIEELEKRYGEQPKDLTWSYHKY
jgi:PHP family Zn ribbon phosphoesterase